MQREDELATVEGDTKRMQREDELTTVEGDTKPQVFNCIKDPGRQDKEEEEAGQEKEGEEAVARQRREKEDVEMTRRLQDQWVGEILQNHNKTSATPCR
ncbi:hypothetical protein STEG23_032789 [Scotinomys teguina]